MYGSSYYECGRNPPYRPPPCPTRPDSPPEIIRGPRPRSPPYHFKL